MGPDRDKGAKLTRAVKVTKNANVVMTAKIALRSRLAAALEAVPEPSRNGRVVVG